MGFTLNICNPHLLLLLLQKKKSAVETGGCLAVQGDAVLPALLLTLQEGCLPTNQLPSRINKLDLVLVNGGGRGDADCNIVSGCI